MLKTLRPEATPKGSRSKGQRFPKLRLVPCMGHAQSILRMYLVPCMGQSPSTGSVAADEVLFLQLLNGPLQLLAQADSVALRTEYYPVERVGYEEYGQLIVS